MVETYLGTGSLRGCQQLVEQRGARKRYAGSLGLALQLALVDQCQPFARRIEDFNTEGRYASRHDTFGQAEGLEGVDAVGGECQESPFVVCLLGARLEDLNTTSDLPQTNG
jgi:hypothetical protein